MPPSITSLPLSRRQIHRIDDARGLRIRCREGSVWVTVDGDPRDYVLERGQSFDPKGGPTLVYALADARVDLVACQSRKETMAMFRRFQAMPLMKAAR